MSRDVQILAQYMPMQPLDPQPGVPTPRDLPAVADTPAAAPRLPREIGGPAGPEPTRYGDWERKGRCIDF